MHYSFVKSILSSVWFIDGSVLSEHMYMLNPNFDFNFYNEGEPKDTIPFFHNGDNVMSYNFSDGSKENDEVVAVIPIRGVMLKNDAPCGPVGMRRVGNRIRQAGNDPNVVAVLIPYETGGGQSIAVPEVTEAIREVQQKKPVLGWIDGMCASAGLYAASYCDHVTAHRETDTVGSIGTMMEMAAPPKEAELPNGSRYVRVYADGSDEKNAEFEQAINDKNYKLVKERILNPHLAQFHSDIKANCPNVKEEHLKGRTWPAKEVMGVFVDDIGDFNYAITKAFEMGRKRKADDNANNQSNDSNHTPETNDSNQNLDTMKYSNIDSVVGVEMQSTEEGVHLSHDHAAAIDAALGEEHPTQEQLDEANNNLATANSTIAERDATIAEHEATIAELKQNAGSTTAKEVVEEEDEGAHSTYEKSKELMDSLPQ